MALEAFFYQSGEAPCISASHLNLAFWRLIENHNRSCEKRIGFLKEIMNKRISDAPENMNRTDFRLRSYLCNMELGLR